MGLLVWDCFYGTTCMGLDFGDMGIWEVAMIQVIWTRSFCLAERRTNLNRLDQKELSALDRVVTFEGAAHLSR
jgi:hypothetical protein